MATTAVCGLQWGDEGKGKLVTQLARQADIVVRYQGGANAGHTVYVKGEKLVLHHLPCGAVVEGCDCLLMPGMVLYPPTLFAEIEAVEKLGITTVGRIHVADRVQITTEYHRSLDKLRETALGGASIGTTGRGIGTTYADKAQRQGIRAADLLDEASLRDMVERSLRIKNPQIQHLGGEQFDIDQVVADLLQQGERLRPYLADTPVVLAKALRSGKNVLFEGAQAAMLDIDHGTYPFVTSSSTMPGGIGAGSGVNVGKIDQVIGVVKAYCTRVGSGPFPTEIHDSLGDTIRAAGGEYGSTTGRPRRCGWFDAKAVSVMAMLGGVTGLCVTKLDVLRGIPTLRICTGYKNWDGDGLPATARASEALEPIYEDLPGFEQDMRGVKVFADLPANAQAFILRLEELSGVPIRYVSTGPGTDELIER
jgi:adenylosuccinate synthase